MREPARTLVFGTLLALQVGIPAWQLTRERSARFGWQLYAGSRARPRFWSLDRAGNAHSVDLSRFLGNGRGDLAIPPGISPQLCPLLPGAVAVRVQEPGGARSEYACP